MTCFLLLVIFIRKISIFCHAVKFNNSYFSFLSFLKKSLLVYWSDKKNHQRINVWQKPESSGVGGNNTFIHNTIIKGAKWLKSNSIHFVCYMEKRAQYMSIKLNRMLLGDLWMFRKKDWMLNLLFKKYVKQKRPTINLHWIQNVMTSVKDIWQGDVPCKINK